MIEAIKKWVNADLETRRPFLPELLKLVRFALVDPSYLVEINNYEPIKNSSECRELIESAKDQYILRNYPEARSVVKYLFNSVIRLSSKRQRLYVVGGCNFGRDRISASAEVYNPIKDCWHPIRPMNHKRCGLELVTLGDSIYAVGDWSDKFRMKSIERYDIVRGEWLEDVPDMQDARSGVGVAALNGSIYVIGGMIMDFSHLGETNKVERYDPLTNNWTDCAPLHQPRLNAGVTVCGGYIYVIGGVYRKLYLNSVERYNPSSDTWSFVTAMSTPRASFGSCCCREKIYAVGGRFDAHSRELDSGEVYDPITDTWLPIETMSRRRCGVKLADLAGQVLAVSRTEQSIQSVESYDPDTGLWSFRAPMKAWRRDFGLVVHPAI